MFKRRSIRIEFTEVDAPRLISVNSMTELVGIQSA
jgi:hypothetical protein